MTLTRSRKKKHAQRPLQRKRKFDIKPSGLAQKKKHISLGRGEAFAQKAVEDNDVRPSTIQKALSLADVPLSGNRRNVMPKGQKAVHGAVCGLYVFAHRIGVSMFSQQRPWLTKLLTAFCRRASGHSKFPFTSIQVNVDYAARPHVDRNNLGQSLIIGLGPYDGGQLWVHDDKGKESLELDEDLPLEPVYKRGSTFKGSLKNIRGKWVRFDGNRLHFTKPFKGKRYSLVYFTCDRYAEAPESVREKLRGSGFTFRWEDRRLQNMLATKKVERRELVRKVTKEKFSFHKGVVPQLVDGDRVTYVSENPKLPGCNAFIRYEKYKTAKTFGEAKKLGALSIDLIFDYNMGFMKVVSIQPSPASWNYEVKPALSGNEKASKQPTPLQKDSRQTVKVRVKEMRPRHPGLEVPRVALIRLAQLIPSLRKVREENWAAEDGPLSQVPLRALRVLLHWAQSGRLRLQTNLQEDVRKAMLAFGEEELASLIRNKYSKD